MEIQNKIHTRDFDYVNATTGMFDPTLLTNVDKNWLAEQPTQNDGSQNMSSEDNDGNFFTRGWASLTERRSNLTEEQKQARRETGLGFLQTGLEAWNIFGKAEEGQSNYNPDYSQQNNNVMGLPSGLVYGVGALAVIGIVVLVVKKSKK